MKAVAVLVTVDGGSVEVTVRVNVSMTDATVKVNFSCLLRLAEEGGCIPVRVETVLGDDSVTKKVLVTVSVGIDLVFVLMIVRFFVMVSLTALVLYLVEHLVEVVYFVLY